MDLDPAPEARGPHLPDAVTAISFGTWFFVLLALARLIWFVRETELGPSPGVGVLLGYVGGFVPATVAILLPAALLFRHPDAATTARTLLVGTILFAAVEGMRVVGPALQPVFERVTPGSEETPYLVPLALALHVGAGDHRDVRRREHRSRAGAGSSLPRPTRDARDRRRRRDRRRGLRGGTRDHGQPPPVRPDPDDADGRGLSRLRDHPRHPVDLRLGLPGSHGRTRRACRRGAGSRLVRGGGRCRGPFSLPFSVGAIANLAEPTPETQDVFTTLIQAISLVYTVGYLALLAGLLLGLPSVEPLEDDEDEDDGAETDDDWANGDEPMPTPIDADRRRRPGLGPVHRQRCREVAQEVEPLVDLGHRGIRPRHQEAGPAGKGHAGQLAPRLGEFATGADRRGSLVDEYDRARSPDGDLLPQRPDARGQLRVGGLVAWRRLLAQIGDPVAGLHEGVVGGLDRRAGREDAGDHQPAPERPTEPALVVVAGLDADR